MGFDGIEPAETQTNGKGWKVVETSTNSLMLVLITREKLTQMGKQMACFVVNFYWDCGRDGIAVWQRAVPLWVNSNHIITNCLSLVLI